MHYYIEGFGHGWPNTMKQDDDNQRYGPVSWYIFFFSHPIFRFSLAISFMLLKIYANAGAHYPRFATKDFVNFFASKSLPTELGEAEDRVRDEL